MASLSTASLHYASVSRYISGFSPTHDLRWVGSLTDCLLSKLFSIAAEKSLVPGLYETVACRHDDSFIILYASYLAYETLIQLLEDFISSSCLLLRFDSYAPARRPDFTKPPQLSSPMRFYCLVVIVLLPSHPQPRSRSSSTDSPP